ncbi:pancreatic progenitor cell differentiation and proliferation factor-like [Leptonychotes weddellii]|uniref:Pancreatic progenitor cell differentiation and proliferation factor-like n=1 Tax=Leptonychotes weddellii TaxID=9713 RepID=A0A7F8QUE2_LEPWE|nr:pancreatic progenitor cell differentiation and proliferation factor-like [Leptonychotes weddellii]
MISFEFFLDGLYYVRDPASALVTEWPSSVSSANASWPSVPIPATCDHRPRPSRGHHQPTSNHLAAIPSSGSLVATHNYYRHRLGSTSSNSSCRSAEYPGEAIPHHPSLPKAHLGHWWASFFWGKSTLPFMPIVLESPECSESPQASSDTVTCDLALEAMRKQPGGQPSKANTGPDPAWPSQPPGFRRH